MPFSSACFAVACSVLADALRHARRLAGEVRTDLLPVDAAAVIVFRSTLVP
jgi:hypothetical protein